MQELSARLAEERPDLAALEVSPASDLDPAAPSPAALPRLFQPAHGRFYLVVASLVCEAPGLPDRQVDPARGEAVGFVLRRREIVGDGREVEHAWSRPDAGGRAAWTPVHGGPRSYDEGEELLALFPVPLQLGGRRRRLWAGLVPTATQETFEDPVAVGAEAGDPDPRAAEVEAHVLGPYRALRDPAARADAAEALDAARLLLRDLASYLDRAHPALWAALRGSGRPAGAAAARGYDLLRGTGVAGPGTTSWAEALAAALPGTPALDSGLASVEGHAVWDSRLEPDTLGECLAALRVEDPAAASPGAPVDLPKLDAGHTYVLRCVHLCRRCRPWKPAVVSEATAPFRLASFFDPDAPARPVRITLPADTSLAALRRVKKGVGVVVSRDLRKKLSRIKGLKDGKLELTAGEDSQGGQICMLSIPIITIVAMVLLMMFVSLLNLVFWWLPLFKVCLPLKKGRS
jgi:hypothetical protein